MVIIILVSLSFLKVYLVSRNTCRVILKTLKNNFQRKKVSLDQRGIRYNTKDSYNNGFCIIRRIKSMWSGISIMENVFFPAWNMRWYELQLSIRIANQRHDNSVQLLTSLPFRKESLKSWIQQDWLLITVGFHLFYTWVGHKLQIVHLY